MMYKLLNKLGPTSLTNLFTYKSEILRLVFVLPKPRTNNMKKSFMYDDASLWNAIPKDILLVEIKFM